MPMSLGDPAVADRPLPRNVVVFGGSGFVGRNLRARLCGQVKCLVGVGQHPLEAPGAETITMDQVHRLSLEGDTAAVQLAAHRYNASSSIAAQSEILPRNVDITRHVYHFCVCRKIQEVRLQVVSKFFF